ncbi:unnamed protein product [Amoebophrya sp. A25]|nr:unnamed protein product [Amoebophrya sp. A25]|eukprot:GSA25T00021172001.1
MRIKKLLRVRHARSWLLHLNAVSQFVLAQDLRATTATTGKDRVDLRTATTGKDRVDLTETTPTTTSALRHIIRTSLSSATERQNRTAGWGQLELLSTTSRPRPVSRTSPYMRREKMTSTSPKIADVSTNGDNPYFRSTIGRAPVYRITLDHYDDPNATTDQKHRELGRKIGEAAGAQLRQWVAEIPKHDEQIILMEKWLHGEASISSSPPGTPKPVDILHNLLSDSELAYPGFYAEMESMALAAGIDVEKVLLSNLRGELLQWADPNEESVKLRRRDGGKLEVVEKATAAEVVKESAEADDVVVESVDAAAPRTHFIDKNPSSSTSDASVSPSKHHKRSCSDVFVNTPGFVGYAHNDDWDSDWQHLSYFLEVYSSRAPDNNKFLFFTFLYPGFLPGMDFLVNRHGVTMTVNSAFPKHYGTSGVTLAHMSRAVVDAHSLEEAVEIVADARASTGGSWNLGCMKSRRVLNVETSGQQLRCGSIVEDTKPAQHQWRFSVMEVVASPSKLPSSQDITTTSTSTASSSVDRNFQFAKTTTNFFHGNEYRHLEGVPFFADPSSEHRLQRFEEFPSTSTSIVDVSTSSPEPTPPALVLSSSENAASNTQSQGTAISVPPSNITSRDLALSFLSDQADPDFPVYRNGYKKDPVWTEMSGLIDVNNSVIELYPTRESLVTKVPGARYTWKYGEDGDVKMSLSAESQSGDKDDMEIYT